SEFCIRDRPRAGEAPLVAGLTEANPHLIAPGDRPPAFAPWRDRVAALGLSYLRVLVDWRRVQPSPDAPPDLAQPADGCLRGVPPCAPFAGIADQLRAARDAGLTPVVVVLDTPEWAAAPARGCEAREAGPRARMPADLGAYRALVRAVLELGRAEGVELPWWAPWNEPNHPLFLGPQRAACDAGRPALAPGLYAELARAMAAELAAAPGEQRLVLGEVAGFDAPRRDAAGAAEFAAALPRDVACADGVWGLHAYVRVEDELAADAQAPGAGALLDAVAAALDGHGCPGGPPPIWITETGTDPAAGADGCRAMAQALAAWRDDPRVQAAFQYTFREDTAFPVGLADAGLTRLEPAYAAWLARAEGRADLAAACAP
ncbi:MAG: hypothetical protein IRZ32_12865, partial [Solirubrobacteraceae bacterium]|nr:hypothetical protein [Solirubrobacteraceae bacterium]